MAMVRRVCKSGGVAAQIEAKTNLTMRKFCELNGLKYKSLLKGYYAKSALRVFKKYGIKIERNLANNRVCA